MKALFALVVISGLIWSFWMTAIWVKRSKKLKKGGKK